MLLYALPEDFSQRDAIDGMGEATSSDKVMGENGTVPDGQFGRINFSQDEATVVAEDAVEDRVSEDELMEIVENPSAHQELEYDVVVESDEGW